MMAMAALTIAGCSQNEVTEINPDADRTIGLDVYTGVQTRGTETTTSTLKEADAGFGILPIKQARKDGIVRKRVQHPILCIMNMLHGLPVVGGMLLCVFGRRMMINLKSATALIR